MPEPIVFICSHGHAYTEWECEMGMTEEAMAADMADREAVWNFNNDTELEADLARQHAAGNFDCPWPWYADDSTEAIEHEVIDV